MRTDVLYGLRPGEVVIPAISENPPHPDGSRKLPAAFPPRPVGVAAT